MGKLNHDAVGIPAQDRARMRGENRDDRVAALEARIAQLERVLAYQLQVPREIVIISNESYTPVPFDSDGRLYLRSAEDTTVSSIDIGRRPHARQHVIDLAVNIDWIKARLLEDTDWLNEVCNYDCDSGIPPTPWPGG